jgi:hypothetical protein
MPFNAWSTSRAIFERLCQLGRLRAGRLGRWTCHKKIDIAHRVVFNKRVANKSMSDRNVVLLMSAGHVSRAALQRARAQAGLFLWYIRLERAPED